ncbi:MAG: AMP-binding protein [Desulfobacterales bacterium]|nr:AMP-binding protein [Desulfobacterales bacterium]
MGLHDFTFYDVICRNAALYGDRPAWFEASDGSECSFSALRERVGRLAAGMQQIGVSKGDRVGVLGKNSLAYFLVYGAAAALGAIVLPINWRLSKDEVIFNLNDCEPKVLFVDDAYQGLIHGVLDRIPSVESCRNLSGGTFGDFDALMDNEGVFRRTDIFSDDGFVIIHTAAVAGRPRGALLSHANVLAANLNIGSGLGVTPGDVHLNLLPLFHVGGLFMASSAFHAGSLNVNMRKFDAELAVTLIQEKKVSLFFDFTPILGQILKEAETSGKSIATLQKVIGLEAPETIDRYHTVTGGTFYCMYGQTETSCISTLAPYRDRPGSAGKAVPLAAVRLVDEDDRPVAPGEVGEIAVKGPTVFKGYWNMEADTASAFRGGWHHTGDMGKFDRDGYLFYAGRRPDKELIKPGGENVYPAEVEAVIMEHPDVDATVVFGVPDPRWKEGIKAVCTLKNSSRLTPEALIAFVGDRIARYKKPQYVTWVDEMPTKEDGTPDREKIKALYGGEQG